MKTTKVITIDTPGDKVWDVFAHDFDNAYKWMASIPKPFGQDNGKKYAGSSSAGRVCELGGPLVQNVAEFSLIEQGENQSVVTFSVTSTLKPLAFVIYPIIKFGFGFFVKQIVEELKFYVETGTPHPRKIKALNKAS